MGYERRRRSATVLNLTPLIDIVFLLLVFFMLTSQFIEEQAVPIDLPQATTGGDSIKQDFVVISITPDDQILVNAEPVLLENLEQTLRDALQAPEVRFVRLRGDQAADLGVAVRVIDAARAAGAESLDIVTRQP